MRTPCGVLTAMSSLRFSRSRMGTWTGTSSAKGSIVTVSRDLGITVVAEGIETAAERAVVAGLGCDLMQGFFFRHPEPWREEDGLSLSAEGSPCPPQSGS